MEISSFVCMYNVCVCVYHAIPRVRVCVCVNSAIAETYIGWVPLSTNHCQPRGVEITG